MPRISIVIPVYYNETSLPLLYERLCSIARESLDFDFELTFVDDGSNDRSFYLLEQLAAHDARIQVIKLSRNFGASNAVLAGLNYATGDCVAIIAADLQDPPELIPKMLEHWREGSKVVLAVREDRHDPVVGKIFAMIFNWMFKRLVLRDFPSQGFDFVLIDRQVAQMLVRLQEKNTNLMALILWVGLKRSTISYVRERRQFGSSRWTFTKKLKYFADSFVGFSYLPIRAVSAIGFALAIVGFIYALVVIAGRLLWGTTIEGWSSLMAIVLLVSGAQMIMTGILGEYMWRTLDEVRRRPSFMIDKVIRMGTADSTEGRTNGWQ